MSTREMLDALRNDDFVEADRAFEVAFSEKAAPRLEQLRKDVAKKRFGKK